LTKINGLEITKDGSFLVNPNLGHPQFLRINQDINMDTFQTNLLFISNIDDSKKFEKSIRNKIKLVPILEYKWKLKLLFEKMKKEIELKKKEKKKGFWSRFKRRKSKEKEDVSLVQKLIDFEKRFPKLKPRAFRGDPLLTIILSAKSVSIIPISNDEYLQDEYCCPQDHLIKHNVFGTFDKFYKVSIEFSLTEEVLEFFKRRDFVMFDIIQENGTSKNRINYHSIIISKKDWKNYTFVHATDLHIAERNDKIYGAIKKWTELFQMKSVDEISESSKKKVRVKLSKYDEFEEIYESKDLDEPRDSLRKRLVNPNNQFRKFIKLMNKKVLQNELDLIVLTGDLIDFTLLSKFPKNVGKYLDFDYEYSNWKIFKEIALNLSQKKRIGMLKGEELLCPIFTILGNHDYRPFHYDIRWAGMYKKIGLKMEEALALNDKLLALPITAISKSERALRAYFLEINPSLDFSLKLGNSNFIFLNSGSDSWKNVRDLVTGHPSVTGLKSRQIIYLENLINHKIHDDDNTFLFVHGPPINPKQKIGFFKRLKKSLRRKIMFKIEEFKESFFRKLGAPTSKARIDDKFNVKYGTISTNWEKLICFCKDYCILTLSGHTHTLKEFRLEDPKGKGSTVSSAPPFSLEKLENPAAVYYDLYSEFCTKSEDIEKFGPFVVQTPALGLGGYLNPKLVGAYREVKVQNGKLTSFKIKFLRK
jgi:predicted MPP superfamily phosphohydrolase